MKLSNRQLRRIIREEYLRTVPDFQLKNEVKTVVENISQLLRKHILSTTNSSEDRDYALSVMNDVVAELEQKMNELVENSIWKLLDKT